MPLLTWHRIKYGRIFHMRIGKRKVFACGRPVTKSASVDSIRPVFCRKCQSEYEWISRF